MLVERKISTKINYDVLKDLDKGITPVDSSGPTIEDVTRQAIAGITEKLGTDPVPVEDFHMQAARPSYSNLTESSSTLIAPRSVPSSGRGRLPSLQSRKRSLPSFASGTTASVAPK